MHISAQNIQVTIGNSRLLDDVSLQVHPGELLGLIGPNGAGKTTLLRVLAGLRPPSGGQVLYDGKPLVRRDRPALARRLAYMAQGSDIAWPLRVDRLVALGRLPHQALFRRDAAEDAAAVSRALRRVGIEELRERALITLSGGERMQVLLARALAVEAEALLADEPVAALDPHH
ncbi:MAG TPA: ABC transporter ATP-binding protein, partial [Kiloniellales bacterium]|nr:ABC transporter ATP-binding protein [Kiloniellales bacterium]